MATYTYEDFQRAAQEAGLLGQFSEADMRLAQQNPDAGMSILKYKTDYRNAPTDEARALANQGAESIRSSYGGYTGGGNGGSFRLDTLSPRNYTASPAPEYENRYDGRINDLLNQIVSRPDFSYDAEFDPLYSQYKKQYTREGQRATQDALGQAAAASGGLPSSYAATAASQAGDYYASQLTDKIPELYQLAYQKYMNDYNMKLSDLQAVQGAEQNDYDKYLNALGQYNTDRSFEYAQLLDEVNSQTSRREEELSRALTAAEFGDNSFLNRLGISTDNDPNELARQLELARLGAQYGDYTGLNGLGITPNVTSGGSYSGGGASKSKMTLATAKEILASGFPTPEAIQVFRDAGYPDDYLINVFGVDPALLGGAGQTESGTGTESAQGGGDISDRARKILKSLETMRGQLSSLDTTNGQLSNNTAIANSIAIYADRGELTDAEARYLFSHFGYNPDEWLE